MKLVVVQRGKMRDKHLLALRDEYLVRFRRFGSLRVIERPAEGRSETKGAAFWPDSSRYRIALDEGGEAPDSEGLARLLAAWSMHHGEIAFALGDAYGHEPAALALANSRLSLSPMTLPHQLAHLVLIEQLYRAGCILAGTPYHHGRT
jgi:23S rRNA (pseudouridine1915-N3)-methyltransferase